MLLEAISLSVYTDAFLLAGHGSSNAADLALLTTADLEQICVLSKVPILPQHQSLILAASKQLAVTLVSSHCVVQGCRLAPLLCSPGQQHVEEEQTSASD